MCLQSRWRVPRRQGSSKWTVCNLEALRSAMQPDSVTQSKAAYGTGLGASDNRSHLPNDGQVGSNAVNLEREASKVFRPKAADFAEMSRQSPSFE
jgi:hypothetical protein